MIPIENEHPWRIALFALVLLCVALYLVEAFTGGPWIIPNDARTFLAWTPRLTDPSLLRGDLIADYWHSVSPPLYRLLFTTGATIGISPRVLALLLAVPLIALTGIGGWKLARQLAGPPPAAFVAAALIVAIAVQDQSIFSATPRAFAPPLLVFFYLGLIGNRPVATLVPLGLLAFIYPAPSVVCLMMLGLARLRLKPRLGIDLSRRGLITIALGTLLVFGGALALKSEATPWKPELRLADIATVPAMDAIGGRNRVRGDDGRLTLICGGRMGYLTEFTSCQKATVGLSQLISILLFVPMLLLGIRGARSRDPDDPDRIFAIVIIATAAAWSIALFMAFQLHLPSRYSQRLLEPLLMIAIVRFAWPMLARHWAAWPGKIAGVAVAVGLLWLFATPDTMLSWPDDEGGFERMAALPPDARLAGISEDMSAIPALTGHVVLAPVEHAIPYQLGYYRPYHAQLADSVTSLRARDPAALVGFIQRHAVDAIALTPDVLKDGTLSRSYFRSLPELPARTGFAPALSSAPAECQLYRGPKLSLFDAPCISRWASKA